jgi:hypothetical protein
MLSMADAATRGNPPIELTATDQTRLATWAVKTAYLIDAYQAPVVPRGFREFWHGTGSAPPAPSAGVAPIPGLPSGRWET